MRVRIIGSAAGGGFPQWNCNCPVCAGAREGRATPRTQSSIVVRSGEEPWYLVNASPDLLRQLAELPDRPLDRDALEPDRRRRPHRRRDRPHRRPAPAARVERPAARLLDRRGARRADRALPAADDARALLRGRLARSCEPGEATPLEGTSLEVETFPTGGDAPLYMGGDATGPRRSASPSATRPTGGTLVYVPAIEALDETVSARLAEGDVRARRRHLLPPRRPRRARPRRTRLLGDGPHAADRRGGDAGRARGARRARSPSSTSTTRTRSCSRIPPSAPRSRVRGLVIS